MSGTHSTPDDKDTLIALLMKENQLAAKTGTVVARQLTQQRHTHENSTAKMIAHIKFLGVELARAENAYRIERAEHRRLRNTLVRGLGAMGTSLTVLGAIVAVSVAVLAMWLCA